MTTLVLIALSLIKQKNYFFILVIMNIPEKVACSGWEPGPPKQEIGSNVAPKQEKRLQNSPKTENRL